MRSVIGGPFLVEEWGVCRECHERIRPGDPAIFGLKGLEHAVHALNGMLPDDIPPLSEWLQLQGAS